jgi:hypothetical protein
VRFLPLIAWLAWTVWVLMHYYTVPATALVLLDGDSEGLPFFLEAASRALRAIAGAAIVLAAAWGIGIVLARPLARAFADRVEGALFTLALGCGGLAYTFLALAGAGFLRSRVVAIVLLLAALPGAVAIVVEARRAPPRMPSLSRFDRVALACGTAAAAFAFIGALAPETEHDALWYHLWLPRVWLDAGRPVDIVEEYVSLYPLTWELLYGAAMVTGGPVGAKLLHFACLPLLAVTTWRLSRLIHPGAAAGLATALLMTAPIVIWEATTAYIDLALTWYVALGVYALARWRERGDTAWLACAAVVFGIAAAVKHLALVALAVAGLWVCSAAFTRTRSLAGAVRTAALFGGLALIVPSPWYARAWAYSGNPVFPDLYALFGAVPASRWDELTDAELRRFKTRFGRERTAANLVRLPWDMTVHGARYGGTIGPLFLILVPAAMFSGSRSRRLLLACAVYLAIWSSPISSFQMRFLVPLVPVLAVLAAAGARRIPGAGAVVVPLMLLNLPPFVEWHEVDRRGYDGWLTHTARAVPLRVVAGGESEAQYLSRTVPSYRAWRFIARALSENERVLTFSGGDHLYGSRPRLWSDATAARELTWGAAAGEEQLVRERLRRSGITHVLFDARQLADRRLESLAIGSDAMMACCLERIYEDSRFALYRLR